MSRMYKKIFLTLVFGLISLTLVSAQTTKTKPKPTPKPTEKTASKETSKDDKNYKIVKEGVGFNGIAVGKSTIKDVEKKFGKGYKLIKHKKYSTQMQYPNGLSFYACQSDKNGEIFDIEIKQPYKVKTSKGIVLGKSTLEDINKIYGKSKDGLEYRGVSFFYSNFKGKKTVTVIDIVENSGIRQCD